MKWWVGPLMVLFLVAGCAPFTSSSGAGGETSNDIPDHIGSPNSMDVPDFKEWSTEEISEKSGYEPFTGEFFKGIYLTTTFFMAEPGESVGTFESFPNQKVRVQLVERNRNLKKVDMVKEEVFRNGEKLTVELPKKKGAIYTYSQEALSENDEVLDTDVSLFYVPREELNARMYVEEDSYGMDETIQVKVENWGPTQLTFGEGYSLEKQSMGGWRSINKYEAFEDIGYFLDPHETSVQDIDLEKQNVNPGTYRVVKTFDAAHTGITEQLAVEFNVEE
ncbi:immunoglobulin-like domain-containing protein [Halobacillus trueperi]|uniref:immunoglobulin-like domain-containing protein n=1 Tax=Halobacillus trueperi TaxID=156205 RepID=UPI0037354C9A